MFSLYDGDDYLNSGLNSTTKEDCVKAGIEFFYGDCENEDAERAINSSAEMQENILETSFDVMVLEHDIILNEF